MSTGYNIFPLGPTFSEDPTWIVGLGLDLPRGWQESRVPAVEDFRSALGDWKDCEYQEVTKGQNLTIWVTRRDTGDAIIIHINLEKASDTEVDTTSWLTFTGGSVFWLVAITARLAHRCGPFLLTESGGGVTIVGPGTPPDVDWFEPR